MKSYYSALRTFLYTLLGLLFLTTASWADNTDDVQLVQQAKWYVQKVNDDIVLKRAYFPMLFGAAQNISFLEVDLNSKKLHLSIAADPAKRILTSDFAREANALAAINGTFFDMKNGGSRMLIKKDGKLMNTTNSNERSQRSNGAITIDGDKVEILQGDPAKAQWSEEISAPNVMVSGPVLILDSKPALLNNAAFNTTRHPRSAVGLTADNKLLLVAVDGRSESGSGVGLSSLTVLLQALGAVDAMNLDGGGSTTLYARGITQSGVVNRPSDKTGERTVANALLVIGE